ncbi:hypothetical protein R1flu_000631 [Riccia fluitans]|uniref:Aminotransferase-like plant mobile domain-containing protein n=1 Tax=Riccia fluitans TaxID=41844 RepID=A0ABD1Y106_9MARC
MRISDRLERDKADKAVGRRRTRVSDRLGRDKVDEAAGRRQTRVSDRLEQDEADEAAGRSRMRLNSFRTRLNAHLNIWNPILCNPCDSWCRVFEESFFGAKHNNKEDFRSIKVMHMMFDKYNPRAYLPASVEHNPNKKLVNGQPYEEVLYYKGAAPYGPMYHLMTTVAELFWSAGRSNKFLTLMILAYLRGLHGHWYNWAKAILHGLRNEIHFLQSRACNNEGGKPIPVVWAPCFVHILFGLRRNLFAGTPLEEAEGWVGWTHVTKDTNMTLPQLHSKFPKLITSLNDLRQRCQLPEEIPIASPKQPVSTRRPRAEDKQPEDIVTASSEQPMSSQRPEDIPIASPEQPVSSKRPHAEDKERGLPSKKKNKVRISSVHDPYCYPAPEGFISGSTPELGTG